MSEADRDEDARLVIEYLNSGARRDILPAKVLYALIRVLNTKDLSLHVRIVKETEDG